MPALFALTLFVGAGLLFLVQPMAAKMILPKFGGTPAVWTTSMVFFQAALLAGYSYAHVSVGRLGPRRQAWLHALVLLGGLFALPLVTLPVAGARDWEPPADVSPVLPLLGLLAISVGLPFFVVSTTAPLLQRWFAATGHREARDPYFLYAASNAGSLLGLLAYPFLVEPNLTLPEQGQWWTIGYVVLVVLILGCAWAGRPEAPAPRAHQESPAGTSSGPALTWGRRLRWVGLAFVPSSLMLGVTTYLTTDIAPMPLLWVIPLALYLVTFILAFARLPDGVPRLLAALLPGALLLQLVLVLAQASRPVAVLVGLHLLSFFVIAFFCHAELARDRPGSRALTEFYLWVSLGGVLGGVFNAIIAPLAFRIILEYPLVGVLACVLHRPAPVKGARSPAPRSLGGLATLLGLAAGGLLLAAFRKRALEVEPLRVTVAGATMGALALLCWLAAWLARRPAALGLGIACAMAAALAAESYSSPYRGQVVYNGRSFFGVHRVYDNGKFLALVHGGIVHGAERLGPDGRPERHPQPLSYFSRIGPVGELYRALRAQRPLRHIGIVGLGAGSLAAYGEPGQEITFYEIDPAVERLARDERFFTFLRDCRARVRVVLGDARLSLVREPDRAFDLLVIDAFSSDAVPVHLATREALRLYRHKLADEGVLAFHASNRYVELPLVVGALAWDADLACFARHDPYTRPTGEQSSDWMALARDRRLLGALAYDPRGREGWQALMSRPPVRAWTDDFSELRSVLKWK